MRRCSRVHLTLGALPCAENDRVPLKRQNKIFLLPTVTYLARYERAHLWKTNTPIPPITTDAPDPASIFAIALSLWQEGQRREQSEKKFNLSEAHHGFDQFMREVMRVANHFETWSCEHIDFAQLEDVWPYMLQDRFGEVCFGIYLRPSHWLPSTTMIVFTSPSGCAFLSNPTKRFRFPWTSSP